MKQIFFRKGNNFNTEQFFMLPKELFSSPKYSSLSNEAKLLYSFMLDRIKLSIKNNRFDSENKAYIFFTIEEIMRLLNICKSKSIKVLAELDEKNGCGLIRKKHTHAGMPTIIYVKRIESDNFSAPSQVAQTYPDRSVKQTSSGIKNKPDQVAETDSNNTDINNTENSYTTSILSYQELKDIKAEKNNSRIRDRLIYKKIIHENIGYEALTNSYSKSDIDPLVNIMLDTVCSNRENITICRDSIPTELVRSRFLNLDMSHIEYVADCLKNTSTKISNIKSYMLASLYNSPDTIGQYFANAVNHDFARIGG